MTSGDPREPLWAGSLAGRVQPGQDDVIVRVLDEEPEESPPPRERPPRSAPAGRRPYLLALLAVVVVAAVAGAGSGSASLTIEDAPSGWGDVPMTCDTVRFEGDDRALETFTCRAVGGRALPAGEYGSPAARWRSDITGAEARESRIRISPEGEVEGWATY